MLFTGLSSTVFWPILSLLNETVGWRITFLICAGLQFFVCLPLHLFALPKPIVTHIESGAADIGPVALSKAARRKAFLLIAAATTISTFITFGISARFLDMMVSFGLPHRRGLRMAACEPSAGNVLPSI